VFFSKILGIERSTLSEALREWFGFENLTHFVVRKDVKENLKSSIEGCSERLGIRIRSVKPVEKANIEFSFSIYNQEIAKKLKELISSIPPEYMVKNDERETYDESAAQAEMYTPLHPYVYEGEYKIEGPFEDLIDFYKKLREVPQVDEKPLKLIFG